MLCAETICYLCVSKIFEKLLRLEKCCFIFTFGMQEHDENADDVSASDRARQRAQKAQKPHSKKKKE